MARKCGTMEDGHKLIRFESKIFSGNPIHILILDTIFIQATRFGYDFYSKCWIRNLFKPDELDTICIHIKQKSPTNIQATGEFTNVTGSLQLYYFKKAAEKSLGVIEKIVVLF
jgi:hypothetical protein